MAVDQLPGRVREFAGYLNKLLTRLDQSTGWCAVFWQRDADGMRACLDGREVPPWDVVEALLTDLAAVYGPAVATQEAERAYALHRASLAAYDSRPGARDALGDRLDAMIRERRHAAERTAELNRRLHSATTSHQAESLRLDLAWAHDDHERATARCTEIRARMEDIARRAFHSPAVGGPHLADGDAGDVFRVAEPGGRTEAGWDRGGRTRDAPDRHARTAAPRDADRPTPTASEPDPEPEATPDPRPAKQRTKRRPRGSARFAGVMDVEEAAPPVVVPETAPAPVAPKARTPRGARFAGVAEEAERPRTPPAREPLDDEARRETVATVERLMRLRSGRRSGEAHALLVEAASWPPARFPLLAAELHRAGLGADWATLLWEAASLPADRLVAAADALAAAGRTTDGEQMLRQGVARPAAEIGTAVLGLAREGREREVRALLGAYVRVRTPEEAARSVEPDPQRLGPLLLNAARGVSEDRHRDLVHALRVAGFAA